MNPRENFEFLSYWIRVRLGVARTAGDRGGMGIEWLLIVGALVAAAILIVGRYGARIADLLNGLNGDGGQAA